MGMVFIPKVGTQITKYLDGQAHGCSTQSPHPRDSGNVTVRAPTDRRNMPCSRGSSEFPAFGSSLGCRAGEILLFLTLIWLHSQDFVLSVYIMCLVLPKGYQASHLRIRMCAIRSRSSDLLFMSLVSVPRCQGHAKIPFLDSNRCPSGEPSLMIRFSLMVKRFIFLITFTDMEVEVSYSCAPWLLSYQTLLFSSSVFLYSYLINICLFMPISAFLSTTEFQFQFFITVITKQPS